MTLIYNVILPITIIIISFIKFLYYTSYNRIRPRKLGKIYRFIRLNDNCILQPNVDFNATEISLPFNDVGTIFHVARIKCARDHYQKINSEYNDSAAIFNLCLAIFGFTYQILLPFIIIVWFLSFIIDLIILRSNITIKDKLAIGVNNTIKIDAMNYLSMNYYEPICYQFKFTDHVEHMIMSPVERYRKLFGRIDIKF